MANKFLKKITCTSSSDLPYISAFVSEGKIKLSEIKYLPKRPGERYASALTSMNLSNKVYNEILGKNLRNNLDSSTRGLIKFYKKTKS